MAKIKVGIAGYGTIGTRLADGVALQDDMELVGIAGHRGDRRDQQESEHRPLQEVRRRHAIWDQDAR